MAGKHLLTEIALSIVHRFVAPQALDVRKVAAAGCADHPRAAIPRQLHRKAADAAGCGVDQDGFPPLETGHSHAAFADSKIEKLIHIVLSVFDKNVLPHDTGISSAAADIDRHIRRFHKSHLERP